MAVHQIYFAGKQFSKLTPHPGNPEQARRTKIRALHSKRFMDIPARQIWTTLLDEGVYRCHWLCQPTRRFHLQSVQPSR